MSPFADHPNDSRPSFLNQIAGQPALLAFLICLVLGSAAVWWRATVRADKAKTLAGAQARACMGALETQFGRAINVAEMLGTLARQNGGMIPNFQRVASDLHATHRDLLVTLELQPSGVLYDIVPRAGYERRLGFNVFNDPAHRLGAIAAVKQHAVTVSGPLHLYRGERGFVVRNPIFQRGRDGRDTFWGFVAVSLRQADVLGAARLQELSSGGFDYNLFTIASAQGNAESIARYGSVSPPDLLRQQLKLPGLELCLAVERRGGWTSRTWLVLEWVAVVGLSGLACLLVNLIEVRREIEASLAEANQRVDRETVERKQAQEEFCMAKDAAAATQNELKQARLQLQQTEARRAEFESRLEKALRSAAQESEAAQAKVSQVERHAAELESALRQAEETVQSRQAELEQARAELQHAQLQVGELEHRLETALRAEKEAAASAAARHQQDEAALAALQERLSAEARAAQEAEAAGAAKIKKLEENAKALRARLREAERAEAQVAELTAQLLAVRSELERKPETPPPPAEAALTEPGSPVPPATAEEGTRPVAEPPAAEPVEEASPAPVESIAPAAQAVAEVEVKLNAPEASPAERANAQETETAPPAPARVAESAPALPAEVETAAPVPALDSTVPAEATAPTATPAPEPQPVPATEAHPPEAPAEPPPAKPAKRKRTRRDDQMDLFGVPAESSAGPVQSEAAQPAVESRSAEPELALATEPPPPKTPEVPADAVPAPEPPQPSAPPEAARAPETTPEPAVEEPVAPEAQEEPVDSAPALPPDLPVIEGLATAAGITNADGNPKLYLKALHQFVEHQAGLPEQVRDALVQGDSAGAERMVQGLVKAAEAIGATNVHAAATTLAAAIRNQSDPGGIEFLWAELEKALRDLITELKPLFKPKEDKPARRLPAPPPLNPAHLRRALNQILPLLADQDPGAKDCLKDHRSTFRSAFTPEGYVEFEQLVKSSDFGVALDHLRKAAKKHGIGI